MLNRHWLTSDLQQRRLFDARKSSLQRRAQRLAARLFFGAMLMALVLHLSACHSLPNRPCEMPQLPMQPALSQPLPSVTYSKQVQSNTEAWAKRVTGTSTTSAP